MIIESGSGKKEGWIESVIFKEPKAIMEQFFLEHGPNIAYIILFLGSLVEGESVVLTAGILAYKGFLSLPAIIAISFTATLFADQALFFIGRLYGPGILERKPKLQEKSQRVFELLHKYNIWFILTFRFIYGIRTVSPLIIGTAGIPVKRFVILNFIAAVIWSVLSCLAGYALGYFFADDLENMMEAAIKYQKITIGTIVGLLVIAILIRRWYTRRKNNS